MENAKEKAIEIFNKMYDNQETTAFGSNCSQYGNARRYAIIAVDEIIKAIDWHEYETPNKEITFWQEVKTEIQNL